MQLFSIDNHEMTVIANDFVPVVPYKTNIVTLGIGQRTDVLVTANGKDTDAVWMRSNISIATGCSFSSQPLALAVIYYPKADTTKSPTTTAQPAPAPVCANDPLSSSVPFYPLKPVANAAVTTNITIAGAFNETNNFVWTMNDSPFRGNYNNPVLLLAKAGNTSYPMDPEWNVYNMGSNGTMRFIVSNNSPIPHPMHFHGHNMFVLHEGPTLDWDGTITNPNNPQRRYVISHPSPIFRTNPVSETFKSFSPLATLSGKSPPTTLVSGPIIATSRGMFPVDSMSISWSDPPILRSSPFQRPLRRLVATGPSTPEETLSIRLTLVCRYYGEAGRTVVLELAGTVMIIMNCHDCNVYTRVSSGELPKLSVKC
jgi:Multicopper oxidase